MTVTKAGTGSGTVTSSPAGINCGTDCWENYNRGTMVTLTATPAADSLFAGWSGNADCSDGLVTMDASKTCTATFDRPLLSITKGGTGTGTVTSSPAGINCGTDCSERYSKGTVVTLTATPAADSLFAGWSGDADCSDGQVTMTASKSCTATFNLPRLTVSVVKSGEGMVTSSPPGINCPTDCVEDYAKGTSVSLTATPACGYCLYGWSGDADCSDGQVTMTASKTCTASFGICGVCR